MAIHERSLVEPERIVRKERLVIDGVDVSGDWNLIILPRVINDYDLDFAKEVMSLPEGKTMIQCYQCSTAPPPVLYITIGMSGTTQGTLYTWQGSGLLMSFKNGRM